MEKKDGGTELIMKYYLVALFDKESYSYVETIQRNICRKFKLYKNVPMLHITMEVIDNPDMVKLEEIVYDIIKPYKKFKAEINSSVCFDPPYKSVNLKVEKKGYIIRLTKHINEILSLHGFEVRKNIEDWDLHIPLANINFSLREWANKEYAAACERSTKEKSHRYIKIDRLELWKSISNRKDMLIKSFPLRDY